MFEFTIPGQSSRPLAVSVAAHALVIALLFALRVSSNLSVSPLARQHVTLIAPVTFPKRASTIPLPRKARTPQPHEFRPPAPAIAHLEMPAVPMIAAPAVETPKPTLPEIPKTPVTVAVIKASGFSEVKPTALPAPKLIIKTSGFQSSESTVTRPGRGTISTAGAFDSSPSTEAAVRRAAVIGRPGGFSDGSKIASTTTRQGSIQSGIFGDTTVDRGAAPSPKEKSAPATLTAVEILSKPKPAYTDEARSNNIEGEVLLEMQFSAAGEARVLRVVRGIGHGLDETAMAAARGIRFRPATRDGGAVDSAAIVHILFQLAN